MAKDDLGGKARQTTDPVASAEKHLNLLKSELKLTNDQEHAWDTYAENTKLFAHKLDSKYGVHPHDKQINAADRFDQHTTLMRERLASFEKMSDAFKQLYTVLSPTQKEIADRHFEKKYH